VLESLTEVVSDSPWTYAFLFWVAALDAILPLVPSETSVITAGVLAAEGDLVLWLVVLTAALGAILGDNCSYWIGRTVGHRVAERLFGAKHHERMMTMERNLAERGGYLIIVGRFIPGGRIAVTLGAGTLEFPWRRFIAFDVAAGFLWASYAALLGYFGGKTFEDNPLKGFAFAFGIALGVTASVEGVRWIRRRRAAST
jgi:membrane protein DedA with SNARE-associated domain